MVSIIMAAYNASRFIHEAIQSVLDQTDPDWELLVIDDGSTDGTAAAVNAFTDNRILYYFNQHGGVSSARNVGLIKMRGDYFCFLDADDILPRNSIAARMHVFKTGPEDLIAVDGIVHTTTPVGELIRVFTPSIRNVNPFRFLIRLSDRCYFGLTWLVKKNSNHQCKFSEDLTHGEDLFFLMCMTRFDGRYDFAQETTLVYRKFPGSAMSNLDGLNHSYHYIFRALKKWPEVFWYQRLLFLLKSRKIMFLSFWFDGGSLRKALRSIFFWNEE
jgi:teichuronic acid biosynthesis glycosyltransferase TuaG